MSLSALAVLACCLGTVIAHAVTLALSSNHWLSTPVAGLSQTDWSAVQSAGLLSFACAHLILALAVDKAVFSAQHRMAQGSFLLLALCLVEASFAFSAQGASLSGLGASNWRLIVIACLVGLVMALIWLHAGGLNPDLWRFNAVLTVVWMALAPLGAFASEGWVGGYERLTGTIYVIWVAGISWLHISSPPPDPRPEPKQR